MWDENRCQDGGASGRTFRATMAPPSPTLCPGVAPPASGSSPTRRTCTAHAGGLLQTSCTGSTTTWWTSNRALPHNSTSNFMISDLLQPIYDSIIGHRASWWLRKHLHGSPAMWTSE